MFKKAVQIRNICREIYPPYFLTNSIFYAKMSKGNLLTLFHGGNEMKRTKRLSAIILAVAMIFASVALASCVSETDIKTQISQTYSEFGNAFYNAVWCCAFNDVYNPADFKEWSTLLKAARSVSKKTKDYPQSDLESYLEQWRAAIDELNALADKYPLPSGITEETVETAAE